MAESYKNSKQSWLPPMNCGKNWNERFALNLLDELPVIKNLKLLLVIGFFFMVFVIDLIIQVFYSSPFEKQLQENEFKQYCLYLNKIAVRKFIFPLLKNELGARERCRSLSPQFPLFFSFLFPFLFLVINVFQFFKLRNKKKSSKTRQFWLVNGSI